MLDISINSLLDFILIVLFFKSLNVSLSAKIVILVFKLVVLIVLIFNIVNSCKILVEISICFDSELFGVISELLFFKRNLLAIVHFQEHVSQYFRLFLPVDLLGIISILFKHVPLILLIHILQQIVKHIKLGIFFLILIDMNIQFDFFQHINIPNLKLTIRIQ